jgi:hypothetical protein
MEFLIYILPFLLGFMHQGIWTVIMYGLCLMGLIYLHILPDIVDIPSRVMSYGLNDSMIYTSLYYTSMSVVVYLGAKILGKYFYAD